MSTCKANNFQIGQSVTATNNGTWYQPATPDGTIRYGIGNAGATTSDVVTLSSSGLSTPALIVSGSTAPTNGMFLPTTNTLAWSTNSTERLRLDSSGNLGLGVTPTASAWPVLQVGYQGNGIWATGQNDVIISSNAYYTAPSWKYAYTNTASYYEQYAGKHIWYTAPSGTAGNAISFTQAMTLDASGNLLVGGTTAYGKAGIEWNANTRGIFAFNTATSGYTDAIAVNEFRGYAPNNTSARFMYCGDTGSERLTIRSNGGIANFSANNVNLSDERVKTAITPAPSWLAKINAIEVVNFKYKDQTFEEPNLGVIAQQVLSVAPELVDEDGFGETPEDGVPLMAIFETDLKYAMLKAIQELSAELNDLKQKVNA